MRYAETPAARLLDAALAAADRPAREIAAEIGLAPNNLSMMRTGSAAIPTQHCARIAEALGLDPLSLMRTCMRSYPDNRSWAAVGVALGLQRAA